MTVVRTRRRWSLRGFAVLALVAAGISVLTLRTNAVSHATPPPPAAQFTDGFSDHGSGDYLRLQLDSSQPHYGAFVVAIPGVGLAWPATAATVSPHSGQDTQLRYDGAGYLDPAAQLDPEFGVDYRPSGTHAAARIRLIGHVDPAHHTGIADVWINDTHYNLSAQGDPSRRTPADPTVSGIVAAYRANDWQALYKLTDSSLTQSETLSQFTELMSQSLHGGRVTAAQTTGSISYTTTTAGTSFAQVPLSLTVTDAQGASRTTSVTLRLIYDNGGTWHMLTLA